MKRTGLYLAVGLILVVNAITLIGVARNRAGEPFQTIELTDRELPLQIIEGDNSGVGLRLAVSRFPGFIRHPALDRARLESLGFRFPVAPPASGGSISVLPRSVFVALEYDGAAWRQWLERAEQNPQAHTGEPGVLGGEDRLQRDRDTSSRLLVIDAAQDAVELRRRYAGQQNVLVVPAVVRARIEDVKDPQTGVITGHNITGDIAQILPPGIQVPLPHSRLLAALGPAAARQEPRYLVTLQYGHRLEPWISSVEIH